MRRLGMMQSHLVLQVSTISRQGLETRPTQSYQARQSNHNARSDQTKTPGPAYLHKIHFKSSSTCLLPLLFSRSSSSPELALSSTTCETRCLSLSSFAR